MLAVDSCPDRRRVEFAGAVRTPDERTGGYAQEAHVVRGLAHAANCAGGTYRSTGRKRVLPAGGQVLAESQELDADAPQLRQRLCTSSSVSEADHEAAFGRHVGSEFSSSPEHFEALGE